MISISPTVEPGGVVLSSSFREKGELGILWQDYLTLGLGHGSSSDKLVFLFLTYVILPDHIVVGRAKRVGWTGMDSKCTKHTIVRPLLEVEMSKKCTLLWREAHFQVKMYKAHHVRTTFGNSDVEKVHAVVARSIFRSEHVQNTTCSRHFWKFRCGKSACRCGAKHSTCRSENAQNTTCSRHFWRFRCRFAWQAQGIVHFVKNKQNVKKTAFLALIFTAVASGRAAARPFAFPLPDAGPELELPITHGGRSAAPWDFRDSRIAACLLILISFSHTSVSDRESFLSYPFFPLRLEEATGDQLPAVLGGVMAFGTKLLSTWSPSSPFLMRSTRLPGSHRDSNSYSNREASSHLAAHAPAASTPDVWPKDRLTGGTAGFDFRAR